MSSTTGAQSKIKVIVAVLVGTDVSKTCNLVVIW